MAWYSAFGFNREPAKPRRMQGAPGFVVHAGYVQDGEKESKLAYHDQRHELYRSIMVNTSIVAAASRYFLNLIGKAEWSFEPAEADKDRKYADLLEAMLTDDPMMPWGRITRSAATYRFYGFSIMEWAVKRREDGVITIKDVAKRMQHTIERWDVDEDGTVLGMVQRRPQDSKYIYLPRAKCLYVVDDSLSDSPEGLGLLRHLVRPYDRLTRYEQLEGIGFDTDLRGIPKVIAPLAELRRSADEGFDEDDDGGSSDGTGDDKATIDKRLTSLVEFLKKHVRGLQTSVLMDSDIYRSEGDNQNTSNTRKWDFDLVNGGQTSMPEMAKAIERVNREMARILGAEQLLLGETSAGSFALSEDKSHQFYLMVDSSLIAVRDQTRRDLIDPLWMLNGFPEEMKPKPKTEAIRHRDIEQISKALNDMAAAGAVLEQDDPVIDEVRDLMGMSRRPDGGKMAAALSRMLQRQMAEDPPLDENDPGMDDE